MTPISTSIALFHDYCSIRGGGERLILTLAEALERCTLVYGYRTRESYEGDAFPKNTISLNVSPGLRRFGMHLPALTLAFSRQRRWAANFPVCIFSGVVAPFAAPGYGEGVNIFYCHTPPRFLFDQREHFLERQGFLKRVTAPMAMACFEVGYRRAIARMDVIVSNSENTRERLRRYLGRESIVVHPPIDTDRFAWCGQGGYYLSTARLTSLKRVDRIIEAFVAMPEKKLIVASGGDEFDSLRRKAAGASNIEFRGWVGDNELFELLGNAIATIYLPKDEDFGMSPVESMAAGKPVIGVAEGGLLETILPNETGILLMPDFTKDDLIEAVRSMTPEKAAAMREACEARAKDFSRDKFIARMKAVIDCERLALLKKD